jgi:hypothetical protein
MIEDAQEREWCRHRAVTSCLVLCLAILLYGSGAHAQSVAFINPGKSDEIYWVTATEGMQAAAHSLGMTFEVQYAQREPLKTLEIAREMVARPAGKRPEYIVITDDYAGNHGELCTAPEVERVAVRRRAYCVFRAECAIGARMRLDDELLAEHRAQSIGGNSRKHIGNAARAIRYDDLYKAGRPFLRLSEAGRGTDPSRQQKMQCERC